MWFVGFSSELACCRNEAAVEWNIHPDHIKSVIMERGDIMSWAVTYTCFAQYSVIQQSSMKKRCVTQETVSVLVTVCDTLLRVLRTSLRCFNKAFLRLPFSCIVGCLCHFLFLKNDFLFLQVIYKVLDPAIPVKDPYSLDIQGKLRLECAPPAVSVRFPLLLLASGLL